MTLLTNMVVTVEQLIESLDASGLVSAAEAQSLLAPSAMGPPPRSAQDLAQTLVARGRLTSYQAGESLAGRAGRLVLGHYVLLDRLGPEGAGRVYKAQHRRLNRVVAIKTLGSLDNSPEALARHHRQVQAVARLAHPSIVATYDVSEAGGVHFLVMQFVEGSDLDDHVRRYGRLETGKAVDYILQAARGLHYAHQKGVIHGDIHPGNLLLDTTGVVRVLNFGVFPPTSDSKLIGAADYVAPEKWIDARPFDGRVDIYSLGCTLYFLLTGRSPAPDAPVMVKRHWHEAGPVPSLRDARPDVSSQLDAVFRRMLARNPEERYATMADVISDLEACVSTRSEVREAPPRAPSLASDDKQESARCDDPNVQFTVYRPKVIRPGKWYDLLAFAHLEELPPDAAADERDPLKEVESQAERILGDQIDHFKHTTEDSISGIPRNEEITFIPELAGIEFDKPRQTFRWLENVHRADFRLRADPDQDGKAVTGHMLVFRGAILLASITLRIKVDSRSASMPSARDTESTSARPYRKIFASYSHRDTPIVEQFERYIETTGDRYFRDVKDLRAGEIWNDRLKALIAEADMFQLFWSSNSIWSEFVRQEWEYALSLRQKGNTFVRPVYWEDPLPERPEAGLPPEELRRRHFIRFAPPLAARQESATKPIGPSIHDRLERMSKPEVVNMTEPSPGTDFAQKHTGEGKAKTQRKSGLFIAVLGAVGMMGLIMAGPLAIVSYFSAPAWLEPWNAIALDVQNRQWQQAEPKLRSFAHDFPESERAPEVPVLLAACEIASEVADGGDLEKALETAEAAYARFRGTPAFQGHATTFYSLTAQIVERFVEESIRDGDAERLKQARRALVLLHSLAEDLPEGWVQERNASLGELVDTAEKRVNKTPP